MDTVASTKYVVSVAQEESMALPWPKPKWAEDKCAVSVALSRQVQGSCGDMQVEDYLRNLSELKSFVKKAADAEGTVRIVVDLEALTGRVDDSTRCAVEEETDEVRRLGVENAVSRVKVPVVAERLAKLRPGLIAVADPWNGEVTTCPDEIAPKKRAII